MDKYFAISRFKDFLNLAPSISYAFALLCGLLLGLGFASPFFLALLPCFFLSPKKMLQVLFFWLGFCTTNFFYHLSECEETKGFALVEIQNVEENIEGFGGYVLHGRVIKFENLPYKNIPFQCYQKKRCAKGSYRIYAELRKKENFYTLKTRDLKDISCSKKDKKNRKNSNIFFQDRTDIKKALMTSLRKNIQDKDCQDFASTLLFASKAPKFLGFLFSRCGLQHLLVISGFHFSLLASFLSFFFHLFQKPRLGNFFLLLCLSLYLLFLGPSPSILRSFFSAILLAFSSFLHKQSNALNSLGWSAIFVLLLKPLYLLQISFQLSFLITFSILLFQPRLKSLVLSVSLVALPSSLFYFQKFALAGLLFNLFAPCMTAIILLLLLLSAIFSWMEGLSAPLFYLSEITMKALLWLLDNWPQRFDFYLFWPDLPQALFLIYLITLFYLGAFLYKPVDKRLFWQNL